MESFCKKEKPYMGTLWNQKERLLHVKLQTSQILRMAWEVKICPGKKKQREERSMLKERLNRKMMQSEITLLKKKGERKREREKLRNKIWPTCLQMNKQLLKRLRMLSPQKRRRKSLKTMKEIRKKGWVMIIVMWNSWSLLMGMATKKLNHNKIRH